MSWEKLQTDPVYRLYHETPATGRHEAFESVVEVQKRMCNFVDELVRSSTEGSFALVSHADPLRTVLSYVLKQPLDEFRRFRISNASLSVVEKEPAKWILRLFNYKESLDLSSDV